MTNIQTKRNHFIVNNKIYIPFNSVIYYEFEQTKCKAFLNHNRSEEDRQVEYYHLAIELLNGKRVCFGIINRNGLYAALNSWSEVEKHNEQVLELKKALDVHLFTFNP